MARIAFILLCHKNPDAIITQVRSLTSAGDYVALHFDARSPDADYRRLCDAFASDTHVTFATRRVKCGWGEWSLVAASLQSLRAAFSAFADASHYFLLSGDCVPVKSAAFAHARLDAHDLDYIEAHDFFDSNWIKTGPHHERLIHRHYFNERTQKRRFYASMTLQKRLGLRRSVPADLRVMIGSQWWCLRRATVMAMLDFIAQRPDITRFFSTTWIPDETFFQTLTRHLVPHAQIANRSLTFLMFSDYGMPVTFYNDHYDLLLGQDALFARKISASTNTLRDRLTALYASDQREFVVSDEGRNLFAFLTGRGRVGRRFTPRFWQTGMTLGRDRQLMVILCKKWHVAKRLTTAIRNCTDLPALDYLFNEADIDLPDLGGFEASLEKRSRHRRAFLRLLFDHHGQDRLVICLDPTSLDILQDFQTDSATLRLLEVDCTLDDAYLRGHAIRVGLAGVPTGDAGFARLLPTIRTEMIHERDAIRDARFEHLSRISESDPAARNAAAIAQFLDIAPDTALALAETPHLFID